MFNMLLLSAGKIKDEDASPRCSWLLVTPNGQKEALQGAGS